MTLRAAVATVLSARPWEAAFVAEAALRGRVRVVARAGGPVELARALPGVDVVIVGSETPWIEPWVLIAARRFGAETIGVHPVGDGPGRALISGASVEFVDTTPAPVLVSSASVLGLTR